VCGPRDAGGDATRRGGPACCFALPAKRSGNQTRVIPAKAVRARPATHDTNRFPPARGAAEATFPGPKSFVGPRRRRHGGVKHSARYQTPPLLSRKCVTQLSLEHGGPPIVFSTTPSASLATGPAATSTVCGNTFPSPGTTSHVIPGGPIYSAHIASSWLDFHAFSPNLCDNLRNERIQPSSQAVAVPGRAGELAEPESHLLSPFNGSPSLPTPNSHLGRHCLTRQHVLCWLAPRKPL